MSLVGKLEEYIGLMTTDFAGFLDCLADDILWINKVPDNVPFSGDYRADRDSTKSSISRDDRTSTFSGICKPSSPTFRPSQMSRRV